ncbi:MAG TPA: hypothetical protein PKK43_14660, partial [Spirochaetota bacterium]|nr:hypothetical protein [Spirochaetota bacterium]
MKTSRVFLSAVSALVIVCVSAASAKYQGSVPSGAWLKNLSVPYSGGDGNFSVNAQVYFPGGYKTGDAVRTLILLHP